MSEQAGGRSAAFNATIITAPTRFWRCPNCGAEKRTRQAGAHTPMHQCARLRGVWAPYLEAHVNGRHELVERADYVGADLPQVDGEGRPVAQVVTHRDNGQDCIILAPCVIARVATHERR